MILNRRNLLASIGLALPAVALPLAAEAATGAKKKKVAPHHVTKASAPKPHRKPHAPTQS